jgi:hypothetical protein
MGYRICKMIGYGGTHPNDASLRDALFENENAGEVNDLIKDAKGCSLEKQEFLAKINLSYPKYFNELVKSVGTVDEETGIWIITTPSFYIDWYRSDSTIDWCEEHPKNDFTTRITELDRPIYPYTEWMNTDTGEYSKPGEDEAPYDLRRPANIVPGVPVVIKIIAEHLGFDWKTLRPKLAVWWT